MLEPPSLRPHAAARPAPGLIVLLGALTAFAAMSIDLYLPALPAMERALGASAEEAQRTISAFLAGIAVGQLLWGPLSDRRGRRLPLFAGLVLYIAASAACALAPDAAALALARFAQGLGGCAAMVISRAAVADRYDQAESARIFSYLTLVLGAAPVLAPLAGSLLLDLGDWRLIFWALALFGIAALAAAALSLPETRAAPARERARALRPLATYRLLLKRRAVAGYLISASAAAAVLFLYITASPALFVSAFGLSPRAFSLVFGLNAIAFVAAAQINRALIARHTPPQIASTALLLSAVVTSAFAALAWAGADSLWLTVAGIMLVMALFGFTQANLAAGALALDRTNAGSLSALLGLSTFGVGALASALAAEWVDGTARPMFSTMAAAALAGLVAFRALVRAR